MQTTQSQSSISPREWHQRLQRQPGAELLDVRTPPEFHTVHVPGARLVPLDELNPQDYLTRRHDGEGPIFVLCQSGERAAKAMEKFQRAGFDGCVLVEGGTQAWVDCGLPVERGVSKVLPLMRQVQITVGFLSALGAGLALTVDSRFALIPLFTGGGLLFAGLTSHCALALILAKMPWNRSQSCDRGSCQPEQK